MGDAALQPDDGLLSPAFLARLAHLQIVSRKRADARHRARRRTRRAGGGTESIDVRAYAPGDDPRRIDWNAYARFERLLVRVVAEESPLRLGLVVDTSASMGFGQPSKLRQACRIAAGLAAIALRAEDRVAALSAADQPKLVTRASGGRRGLQQLLAGLNALEPERLTHLAAASHAVTAALGGRGLCVILSDLLDPSGALTAARALRLRGHEVALVEVLTPFELDPGLVADDLEGCDLVDAETGELVELPPHGALAAYRETLAEHRMQLEQEASELEVPVLSVSTEDPFDEVVSLALERGVLRGAGMGTASATRPSDVGEAA